MLTNFRLLADRKLWRHTGDRRDGHWVEVIAHRPEVRLEGVEVFDDFLVVARADRRHARIRVHDLRADETWSLRPQKVGSSQSTKSHPRVGSGRTPTRASKMLRVLVDGHASRSCLDLDLSNRRLDRAQTPTRPRRLRPRTAT